jgi:hypothetical protein
MNNIRLLGDLFVSCCSDLGGEPNKVKCKLRYPDLVLIRQIFCYWAKDSELFTLSEIGNEMGERDHSTVVYSYRRVDKLYKKGRARYVQAIHKTAENVEKLILKYEEPSIDIQIEKLISKIYQTDYLNCSSRTKTKLKLLLLTIINHEQCTKKIKDSF